MRRIGVTSARLGVLGMGMLLGACSWFDNGTARIADGIGTAGGRLGMPWGSPNAVPPEQSTTIARLTGSAAPLAPLTTEGGDVWPVPEAPRSTLANPDAAMRGIPTYRPGDYDRPSAPAGRSQWQPTDPVSPAPLPPGLRSGASAPPPPLRQPDLPGPQAVAPPLPNVNAPPPRRADGRVFMPPLGGPGVTTGGTDRVQGYITPGGGSGTAITDGPTTTLIGPNGQVQVVPTPR